jgi:phosphoserine phosphatase RsbU/P
MADHTNWQTCLEMLREPLARIAQAWLASGATTFSVSCAGKRIAHWGADTDAMDVRVPLLDGELGIAGVGEPTAPSRLAADATLLAHIAKTETDLETMTGELVETQDQLLALYDLDHSIRKHLSATETLNAVCREATRLVPVAASIGWLVTGTGEAIITQYPVESTSAERVHELIRQVAAREDSVLQNNHADNYFLIPLQVHGATSAGLAFVNKLSGEFTSPDLKLARAIADQAGAQIENVLLYQETLAQAKLQNEMDLAVRIQLSLLPRAHPDIVGLDVFGTSRPASLVGGDFFGYITRLDQPFTFVVGDVAGKGMSAALLMSMSYTVIRNAMRFMPSPTPASVLGRVSDDLYDELSDVGAFVTVFIAQYDPITRTLTYANAGHSPVIYCPAHGTPELLIADGTAMGVLPGKWWDDHTITFNPGDLLIVATDGFSEAQNALEDMFGYERLLNLVGDRRAQSAQQIGLALLQATDQFAAGQAQADDQTLIVIKGANLDG